MAFSDFKNIEQVIQLYPVEIDRARFLPDISLELPALFLENLEFLLEKQAAQETEVFYRESFIFPFLQQTWKRYPNLKLWVGQYLKYDDKLFGEPDYFVSAGMEGQVISKLVNKPLLAVVEAKKQDFEGGWAQCLAELIACQKLNEQKPLVLYGVVSTGIYWEFGKLENTTFTRDLNSYTVADPQKVFGALDFVFSECEKQLLIA